MGFLGNLFGGDSGQSPEQAAKNILGIQKMPNRGITDLDSNSKALTDLAYQEALKDPTQIANEQTAGIEKAGNLFSTPESQMRRSQSLGMASDPSGDAAIARRYKNVFGGDVGRIRQAAELSAYDTKGRNMDRATGMVDKTEAIRQGAAERAAEYDSARRAARQQVISDALGAAGTIAGFAVGGATGAAAVNNAQQESKGPSGSMQPRRY